MSDAWRVDDAGELQVGRLEVIEQADAAAQHDWHQVDGDLVEQASARALLEDRGPIRTTLLLAAAVRACSTARSIPPTGLPC